MTRPTATPRPGFTLVELLVVMAVVIALAALALLVVPDALTQDRTTDGAGTVRQTLMIAKARALKEGAPRGVRFLVGTDPVNPSKTEPRWATEMQYIEQPPPLAPAGPTEYIEFAFARDTNGNLATTPPNAPVGSTITPPEVYHWNMSQPMLDLLNTASAAGPVQFQAKIGDERVVLLIAGPPPAAALVAPNPRAGARQLTLAANQDYGPLLRALGTGTSVLLTTFWATRPPQPLLGEPTVQLPRNVCVDLASSSVRAAAGGTDYDLLFAPNGEVLYRPEGQIHLWVRDYTKPGGDSAAPAPAPPGDFNAGGEQQVVSLKTKSGALGVFPIAHPPYAAGENAFKFAREAASSP